MGVEQPTLFPEPDGWGDGRSLHDVEYLHVRAKRIVNRVPEASRMPFRFTINAYRGCAHACTYCFARPTHEFLGMNAADDFERRIVVKVNAVEKLRRELREPRWGGDHIAMGTNTDPYQPAEGRYKLTRGIIEALGEARNEFSILTKSPMIIRDLDVLAAAAERTRVRCNFSIGTRRRRRVAGERAGHAASAPAHRGRPAPERRRHPVRRPRRADPAGHLRRRGPPRGGRRGRPRGRRRLDHADLPAPAAGRPRGLHAVAFESTGPTSCIATASSMPSSYATAAGARTSQLVEELVRKHGGVPVAAAGTRLAA